MNPSSEKRKARGTIGLLFVIVVFCVIYLAEIAAILRINEGHFLYTLDDPYIHMALAGQISNGHYGINPNESSAPASTILWPFVLAPFSHLDFFSYVPAVMNLFASIGILFCFYKILNLSLKSVNETARNTFVTGTLFCLIPATNLVGLAFTGMEHSVQVFLSAALLLGVIIQQESDVIPRWFPAVVVLGPLIRYENLALSFAVLLLMAVRGKWKLVFSCTAMIVASVAAFSLFLHERNLGWFPSSVIVKSSIVRSGSRLHAFKDNFLGNIQLREGTVVTCGFIILAAIATFGRHIKDRQLAFCIALATLAHLIAGGFGWFHRYEIYIVATDLLAILYLFRSRLSSIIFERGAWLSVSFFVVIVVVLFYPYARVIVSNPIASNNIYEQQYQMRRFVQESFPTPSAVNDLGLVAYGNKNYVLDLYGLASQEASEMRAAKKNAEWMDRLTQKYGVKVVMIHESWFPYLPQNWQLLGRLRLGKRKVSPGDPTVAFYATDGVSEDLKQALARFRSTLPRDVIFSD
ncbi:MAG: hypothetical protein C5B54_07885 [Acidobacteria bacterium]|nr:MAG: hypothetical protein C5B54_07885 [Acidobacteriota bacterium]